MKKILILIFVLCMFCLISNDFGYEAYAFQPNDYKLDIVGFNGCTGDSFYETSTRVLVTYNGEGVDFLIPSDFSISNFQRHKSGCVDLEISEVINEGEGIYCVKLIPVSDDSATCNINLESPAGYSFLLKINKITPSYKAGGTILSSAWRYYNK